MIWQVENDEYATSVLEKNWPHVQRFGDIREVRQLPYVDLICGGFPCQDISNAGKRKGITGERSRLWKEFIRVIRLVRPRYVIVENVPALRSRGLGTVLGDLAASGYDAEWDCIPAAAVGAPHQRDRIFIVAYARSSGRQQVAGSAYGDESADEGRAALQADELTGDSERHRARSVAHAHSCGCDRQPWDERQSQTKRGRPAKGNSLANPKCTRVEKCIDARRKAAPHTESPGPSASVANSNCAGVAQFSREETDWSIGGDPCGARIQISDANGHGLEEQRIFRSQAHIAANSPWAVECRLGKHPNGLSARLDSCRGWECGIPRVTTGQEKRVSRLKCLGNSVVPQVAQAIGEMIIEFDKRRL